MPRVVPSQVVEFIDNIWNLDKGEPKAGFRPGKEYAVHMRGILNLARDVPPELLQLSGPDYTNFTLGLCGLEYIDKWWENKTSVPDADVRDVHPVLLIRRALVQCPDESPSPTTAALTFITDVDLRDSIRTDISTANSALHNGEWKAATVLAGSATEALLLWALSSRTTHAAITGAVKALAGTPGFAKKPKSVAKLDEWTLHQYTEVAHHLGIIGGDTAKQVRLARCFRNLIHPGAVMRTAEKCTRATALIAIAAQERVAEELS